MTEKKQAKEIHNLPEARVINASLFERDAYQGPTGAPGKAMYKIELAFDPKDIGEGSDIENLLADAVEDRWGADAAEAWLNLDDSGAFHYATPIIDGNVLAEGREAKGKEGDAYKGKLVIRTNTSFNKDGQEGPGGINVYGPDCSAIDATRQSEVYSGCYGIAAVTISTYETQPQRRGDKVTRGVKFYLVAFQKTRDGDKLAKSQDRSSLFKPVAGAPAGAPGRRRRAG